jgi:hypothetical protein
MSLFDSASLVVTPNGYKEDKLYSIKPTDGSGDLVVTRATTATRVNSAGLVEIVPRNLLTYSNTFTNASWNLEDATISANVAISPDGTQNASKLVSNTNNTDHTIYKEVSTSVERTFSCYVKADGYNYVFLGNNNGTASQGVFFNLTNGTISQNTSTFTASIQSVGNGWYRCIISQSSWSIQYAMICLSSNGTSFTFAGNGTSGVLIYGAQLVDGSSAKEYFPTTDRLNVPRIDYTNGSCPSILVEPQRTNVNLYSEQFDNAYWTKQATTVTANNTTSPDGTINADKIISTAVNDEHLVYYFEPTLLNQVLTVSLFVKKLNYRYAILRSFTTGAYRTSVFDLDNGTITSQDLGTSTIKNYGNGWYRISTTFTSPLGVFGIQYGFSATTGFTYNGDGTSANYAWGFQTELGSYATSYIPTVASSVTRNADVISKTGISSLIGQTEGTIFVEEIYDANVANNGGVDDTLVSLSDGTTNNLISIFHYGNGGGVDRKVLFFIRLSNVNQAAFYSSSLPSGTYKIAMAYKNNDVAFYINGVQLGTDTSATIPATSALTLVDPVTVLAATKTVNFKNIALFKTRLSNTELATLTTI